MGMIRPLRGYVLIETMNEEKSEAGLYKPESSKDKPSKGRVLAVGGDLPHYESSSYEGNGISRTPNEQPQVKIGDICIFHKWASQDIPDVKNQVLVKFSDIGGIVEEENGKTN